MSSLATPLPISPPPAAVGGVALTNRSGEQITADNSSILTACHGCVHRLSACHAVHMFSSRHTHSHITCLPHIAHTSRGSKGQ